MSNCSEVCKNMVPKVFISSTFYDLKYVRENIGAFVEHYGFTPIISETGNIGYVPFESLDTSCYAAMRASNMSILIIGGRYGSPASDEAMPESAFKQYKSVTRREFEFAVANSVPIYVFIEASVYYEFETYKKNRNKLEDGTLDIAFASVDNINVFRFISEIYSIKGVPVWSFTKVEDIKEKLKKQWATLFLQQLNQIKNDAINKRLQSPINSIETSVNQMNILLDKLGNIILNNCSEDSTAIRQRQIIEETAMALANSFEFVIVKKKQELSPFIEFFIDKFYDAKDNNILSCGLSDDYEDQQIFDAYFNYDGVILVEHNDYWQNHIDSINDARNLKKELVERLLKNDCLKKMNLL